MAKRKWHGSKWIRQERRLGIYLRDGMACAYCGASVEDGATLSLDHVKPHSHGGSNASKNLVTCCRRCNSARGNRPVADFAAAVANYNRTDARAIVAHVHNTRRRKVRKAEALEIMARRGTFTEAVETASEQA